MSGVRVALHVHSTFSYDGNRSLRWIGRAFSRAGFRVVLVAEHDRRFDEERFVALTTACHEASTDDLLLVPGIEYSDRANRVHVPVWGPRRFLGEALATSELLEHVRADGAVAMLAHPARRAAHQVLPRGWEDAVAGVEVWNRKYDGLAPSRTALAMLEERPGLRPFVGLDFHRDRQLAPLAMLCDLRGAPVSEAAVLDALRSGRCRPELAGVPLDRFTTGPGRTLVEGLNTARNAAHGAVRAGRRAARRGRVR